MKKKLVLSTLLILVLTSIFAANAYATNIEDVPSRTGYTFNGWVPITSDTQISNTDTVTALVAETKKRLLLIQILLQVPLLPIRLSVSEMAAYSLFPDRR